jgi:hypothetical protein
MEPKIAIAIIGEKCKRLQERGYLGRGLLERRTFERGGLDRDQFVAPGSETDFLGIG